MRIKKETGVGGTNSGRGETEMKRENPRDTAPADMETAVKGRECDRQTKGLDLGETVLAGAERSGLRQLG